MVKKPSNELPRENPFRNILQMLKASVGRMPAALIVILAVALVAAVLTGVFLKFAGSGDNRVVYLPQRIEAKSGARTGENQLRGVWVFQDAQNVSTLRIGSGVFEMIVWPKGSKYTRYFLRGGYRVAGDVLILQQRKDLGAPVDPQRLELTFMPISFSDVNLRLSFRGNQMLWSVPKREIRNLPESLRTDGDIVWAKLSNTP